MGRDNNNFSRFSPAEDLVGNIGKSTFIPPIHGADHKWHRGLRPMAFALRSVQELDAQALTRDMCEKYGGNLSLMLAKIKRLKYALPQVPQDFNGVLLVLKR